MPGITFPEFARLIWNPTAWDRAECSGQCERERALAALAGALTGVRGASARDTAVLLRHVLRVESERRRTPQRLRVPRFEPWPTPEVWAESSVRVISESTDSFVVEADVWRSSWSNSEAARNAFEEIDRRDLRAAAGDPFLERTTRFDVYASDGQRDAIRAVTTMLPGSTVAVPLPTGAGKTSVALIRGLANQGAGTSLVIVPTTALALDLERKTTPLLVDNGFAATRTAYHHGLPLDEREEIRSSIRSGSQRFVFASPESAMTSLRPSLLAAAENGTLENLIVDEAHIVAQWGDSFRPAYQHLSGLRSALIDAQSAHRRNTLRTLLLSATLTTYSLALLQSMFGDPGPFSLVGQLALRPEHEYWFWEMDQDARDAAVNESIDNLPRPMIVYTTTRDDAYRLGTTLSDRGYARFAVFTGETSSAQREAVIEDWSSGALDLVVGTSAFGLGVDAPHVRAVVHATIPESLDRLYQEVGRSGRDGLSANSLTIWTRQDLEMAGSLAAKKLVSPTKAQDRWRAMVRSADPSVTARDELSVDIDALRPGLRRKTDYNRLWNFRTLQVMARAGMVEILSEALPAIPPEADEQTVDRIWSDWFSRVRVRQLRGDLETVGPWTDEFERARDAMKQAGEMGLRDLLGILGEQSCVGEGLVGTYRISTDAGQWYQPHAACGGCGYCRAIDQEPYQMVAPPFRTRFSENLAHTPAIDSVFGTRAPRFVLYDDVSSPEVVQAIDRLVRHGVRHLFIPPNLRERYLAMTDPFPSEVFPPVFFDDSESWNRPEEPVVWGSALVVLEKPTTTTLRRVDSVARPPAFVAVPSDTEDPQHRGRRLADMRVSYSLSLWRDL